MSARPGALKSALRQPNGTAHTRAAGQTAQREAAKEPAAKDPAKPAADAEPAKARLLADGGGASLKDYQLGAVLGTGSFGRVSLAKHTATGVTYAIKALSKAYIVKNQQVQHVRTEREVLRLLEHPFIVRLAASFQDEAAVYFVMEFVCGGEFFRHLKSRGALPEDAARFYAAEVLVAFEHMHAQDIIYRDLKPENLLLDAKGHIKITDLGFAKVLAGGKRTYTLCGTPDYLAPELILNKGHGKPVDWWAFGVLVFEMLAGFPPFYDEDVTNTYKKILAGRFAFPAHFSVAARDLVRKLLQADLSKRFGCLAGGVADIKAHAWFRGTDWATVVAKGYEPPIKPVVRGEDDHSNFDDYSALPPLKHEFQLSTTEQLLFTGI